MVSMAYVARAPGNPVSLHRARLGRGHAQAHARGPLETVRVRRAAYLVLPQRGCLEAAHRPIGSRDLLLPRQSTNCIFLV
jgi:hypothetical protein